MSRTILPDDLWTLLAPLLPPDKPAKSNGRPPVRNRQALTGILFVLRTGTPREHLPRELGCGCGMTCWRRLRDWNEAGLWQLMHEALLAQLHQADRIDWSRAVVDSSSVRTVFGGSERAPIQPIGAKRAANTTWSRTATAFPWPLRSRGRMRTMSRS